jgi:hypothetical protein
MSFVVDKSDSEAGFHVMLSNFSLLVCFCQCCIIISIFLLLLSEGQGAESGNFQVKAMLPWKLVASELNLCQLSVCC